MVIGYLFYENGRLSEDLSYANAAKNKLQLEKDHAHDKEVKLVEEKGKLNGQLLALQAEYDKCLRMFEDLRNSSAEDKLKLTSLIPQIKEDHFRVDVMKDEIAEKKDSIRSLQESLSNKEDELQQLRHVNGACQNRLAVLEDRLSSSWLATLWRILGLL